MSSKKTTTGFNNNFAKLSKSVFSGTQHDSLLNGFKPSSGLTFGKPSSLKALTPAQNSGLDWGALAKQTATNAGSSLLSGGGLLGGIGLGSVISGIASLFGAGQKKSLPPLQLFNMQDAMNQTVHLQGSSAGSSGSAVHVHVQTMDSQSFMNRSGDIARAVKTAMLNSHSLNDVVSEL